MMKLKFFMTVFGYTTTHGLFQATLKKGVISIGFQRHYLLLNQAL